MKKGNVSLTKPVIYFLFNTPPCKVQPLVAPASLGRFIFLIIVISGLRATVFTCSKVLN